MVFQNEDIGGIVLPICYNHLVQGVIYNCISEDLSKFLHDKGFIFGNRKFKLFTFSRLQGRYTLDKKNGKIIYVSDVNLLLSSPINRFIKEIANTLVRRGFIMLGENKLRVTEMAFPGMPNISKETRIYTLSPITVYSTLLTPEGRKKTYYYSPYERDFSKLINSNAKKKHFLIRGKSLKSELFIEPLRVKEVVVKYKGTIIKGWIGNFKLKGPKSLIETVYEAGLGSKNSQGFGMFEVI